MRIRSSILPIALALALVAPAATAFADSPQRNRHRKPERRQDDRLERRFHTLDTNGDNSLSRTEWQGDSNGFERLDRDNDGSLSFEEFTRRG